MINDRIRHTKESLINALEQSLGVVTTACKSVGIHRSTFYEYYNNDEDFRQKVDDFVLTKINDLPEDYTAEKLPPAVQNSIQPIILSARQQYADSARLLAGMKGQVGTPDYLKVMDGMNRSKKVIENLNTNLVDLQNLTNEYVENREMMSKGMNAEKVAALDEIFFKKKYTMKFMNEGSTLYKNC